MQDERDNEPSLAALAWLPNLDEAGFKAFITSPTTNALGLFQAGEPRHHPTSPTSRLGGYTLLGTIWGTCFPPEAELHGIMVDVEHQQKGYGTLLLEAWLDACGQRGCTRVFLEVAASNIKAQGLYHKFGGTVAGVRKNYYTHYGWRDPKDPGHPAEFLHHEALPSDRGERDALVFCLPLSPQTL